MNKTVLQHSIEVLKILYMVVAGLAIAIGLQRFVFLIPKIVLTSADSI